MAGGKHRPLVVMRRILLGLLILFLSALVAIYFLGRSGRSQRPTQPVADDRPSGDGEALVLSGEGFDYAVTKEGRQLFRVRAERIVSRSEEDYTLEGVAVDLMRENGDQYHIESDSGTYNSESQATLLEGTVRFRGPRDVELDTERLELRRSGKLAIADSPVTFRFLDRFYGRADRMRINARKDTFILIGEVQVDSLPGVALPLSLRCRRFSYDRSDRVLRTEGDVEVRRGGSALRARRLTLTLAEDERTVRFVRALWGVNGQYLRQDPEGTTSILGLRGEELSVAFIEGTDEPLEGEIEGTARVPAVLTQSDDSGLARRVQATYMVADFLAGELERARAFGDVVIDESLSFAVTPLRRICARTADATVLPDGTLGLAVLEGEVELHEAGIQAAGDRVVSDAASDEIEMTGDEAWVLAERGRIQSPRLVYRRESGTIEASDGVQATIEPNGDVSLGGSPGNQELPVRIQSLKAEWSDDPSTVRFLEEVRAWQGENFLLADTLVGEPDIGRITAEGGVRTVWRPEPEEEAADVVEATVEGPGAGDNGGRGEEDAGEGTDGEGDETGEADGEGGESGLELENEPMEITAQQMVYEREERLLTYSGAVRAHQAGRTLRCNEVQILENEDGDFDELTCDGAARIEDPLGGKTVTGELVVYTPAAATATVTGSPVVMTDVDGTQIRGRKLLYDFERGTAQIQSDPEEDYVEEEEADDEEELGGEEELDDQGGVEGGDEELGEAGSGGVGP